MTKSPHMSKNVADRTLPELVTTTSRAAQESAGIARNPAQG
jgi:hypothetical protein